MIFDIQNANPALPNQGLLGNYYNRTFSDIFPDETHFESAYITSGLYDEDNTIKKIKLVYYLLYSRYGNSVVANYDENQFIYGVFSTIFMYGPSWEAQLKTQTELRKLLESDELFDGTITVNNHSYNPSTPPATNAFDALSTINAQNASKWKKSKLEAYASLAEILKSDVTEAFLDKFKKLFLTIIAPNAPLWYETTPEEQEIIGV